MKNQLLMSVLVIALIGAVIFLFAKNRELKQKSGDSGMGMGTMEEDPKVINGGGMGMMGELGDKPN